MIIRAAAAQDAAAIGQLWSQLIEYHRQLDDRMPTAAPDGADRYANRIQDSIDDSHTRVFVADDAGQVVGYVMGIIVDLLPEMFTEERGGFLADIFVLPEYRDRGIGKALVNALKAWFRAQEIQHFEWYVAAKNQAGIAFWRSVQGEEVMLRMRATTDMD